MPTAVKSNNTSLTLKQLFYYQLYYLASSFQYNFRAEQRASSNLIGLAILTAPKLETSQTEANSPVLISYDIKSLTWFCYRNAKFWAEFGYGKYLIVSFWYASVAYQARLVSPWVFWLDYVSPKYEPWLDQTSPICRRSVSKRYD